MAAPKKDWFVLFRHWYDESGVHQIEQLAVMHEYSSWDVIDEANRSYTLEPGQQFGAEMCSRSRAVKIAERLNARKNYYDIDWSRTEFIEFMCLPAYVGDEQRYVRK